MGAALHPASLAAGLKTLYSLPRDAPLFYGLEVES
jgi:hypothetical protein